MSFKVRNQNLYLAFFFILLQIAVIYSNIVQGRLDLFLWACDNAPIIFAIGFFLNNIDLIKGVINVVLIGQFLWVLDFLVKLVTGGYLSGVTQYFFLNPLAESSITSLFLHVFSAFLALIFVYKYKPTKKALYYSAVYILLLFALTFSFALRGENINCIERICGFPQLTFPGYSYVSPILAFIFAVLPAHGIQYLLYRLRLRSSHK